ncbi:MAG: ATP-dependent helicase, partial [Lentisphaeraceae bacterium]|nr:ATP-dependent helicase [Lentisphaeraceae bacterium]
MLNKTQDKVARHKSGAILVIAGAGTGKTRTLTHRFAALISQGVNPRRILLLTFTRKAAAEMQERAMKLIDTDKHQVNEQNVGGTFHATAFRWLRRLERMSSGFNILDDSDQKRLLKKILQDEDREYMKQLSISNADLLQMRSLAINLQTDLPSVVHRFFPVAIFGAEFFNGIMTKYQAAKEKRHLFDYDDILNEWLKLLKSPQGDIIKQSYDYVMVDEFQATSRVQREILKELVSKHENLMAVGDDC